MDWHHSWYAYSSITNKPRREFTPNQSGNYNYKLISENKNLNFSNSFLVEPIELELLTKRIPDSNNVRVNSLHKKLIQT